MATVPHSVPTRIAHLTAELYGREDDTLIAWRQTCVDATDALRPQYAGERLSKALTLAQGGAVTLEEGGCALVQSGNVHYEVHADGRCNCPDHEKRGGPCKHVLAVLIHTQTLALLEIQSAPWEPEPPAPSTPPGFATVADLQRAHPTSATWNVHEAPVSSCFKIRVGACEWTHIIRGADDAEFHRRLRDFVSTCREVVQALDALQQERDNAQAQPTPGLTSEALQAIQALLAASPGASNGAAANGHANAHTPAQPPRCPAHGDMRESTKVPGTWFCTQKLPTGKYCPSKA